MPRRFKSDAMQAIHETMADLARVDAITPDTMRAFDRMCGESEAQTAAQMTFNVFKNATGQWHWHLLASDGRVIAASGQGFKTKKECVAAIELVRHAQEARIVAA